MELFEDKKHTIHQLFQNEFSTLFKIKGNRAALWGWRDFIIEKNLGIEFYKHSDIFPGSYVVYKIIDYHQWILTRLRYGIV